MTAFCEASTAMPFGELDTCVACIYEFENDILFTHDLSVLLTRDFDESDGSNASKTRAM
jgi:hypothetical protein